MPGPAGILVNVLVIIMAYTKVPLCIYPIAAGLDELVPRRKPPGSEDGKTVDTADAEAPEGSIRTEEGGVGGGMLVKVGVLVTFLLTKLACPSITVVLGYVGWAVAPMVMFVFPTACYLKLFHDELHPPNGVVARHGCVEINQ